MVDENVVSNQIVRVRIGDVCCSITCPDERTADYINQRYVKFLSKKPADIRIKLDTVKRFSPRYLESLPPSLKHLKWGDQVAAICRVDGAGSSAPPLCINITVERYQLTTRYEYKIMNTLLPVAYYTVQRRTYPDQLPAMVLHACGIIRNGRIIIFTGPSETGKTTIARFCGSEHGSLVNDEMLLLSGTGTSTGEYRAQGIPIIGGVPHHSSETAPPACVMMLKQAPRTAIRPLDRVEAYLRFIRQIIAPRELTRLDDDIKVILSETTRFADEFTKSVPFFELEFALDKEALWQAIEEIEEII